MTTPTQSALNDEEIDDFLARHQTAVLSLSNDSEPYAIPVTYRFDPDTRRFYFRLVFAPSSEKLQFLPDVPPARLVVYEEAAPEFGSVIAVGQPEELSRSEIVAEQVAQFGQTSRPLFEMWEDSKDNLDVRLFELDPDRLTGRQITTE